MKFVPNNKNEHVQDYTLALGQLLRSVHMEKSFVEVHQENAVRSLIAYCLLLTSLIAL